MVAKMERGALSTSLSVLLVLFIIQFLTGVTLNLLIALPTNVFPASGGSLIDTLTYIFTGGNLFLTSHFIIDTLIIAVGIINVLLVIHKNNVYKAYLQSASYQCSQPLSTAHVLLPQTSVSTGSLSVWLLGFC